MAGADTPKAAQATQVLYQEPAPGVARILMNRPERRNAQGVVMTHQLDDAIRRACHDESISVIILAGAGDHFNAGHDLGIDEAPDPTPENAKGFWGEFQADGWEGTYSREHELYIDACERWRNAPKPMIAEVQGAVVTGGLTLVWACDLIVCSEDARFRDTTGHDMAMPGVEFFQHPYEMSIRQAKEWLFTGDWMDARTALQRGMVNHVVPREVLSKAALDLAIKVAKTDRFTLKLIKESMNAVQDTAGRQQAIKYAFALHQVGHLHNMLPSGYPVDFNRLSPSLQEKMAQRWQRHDRPSRA